MQNAETVLDVLQSPESPVHRKGARWVRRKAARKRPTPDHLGAGPRRAAHPVARCTPAAPARWRGPVIRRWSRHSRRSVPIEAFGDRVRPRCPDRRADDPDVGAGEYSVEGGSELAVAVADQEPEPAGVVAEVHEQVAGLLGDPGAGGMRGDAERCVRGGCRARSRKDVEPAQEDGVDMGEIDGQDRVGLRAGTVARSVRTVAGRDRCRRSSGSSRRWRRRPGGRVRRARPGSPASPSLDFSSGWQVRPELQPCNFDHGLPVRG